MIELLFLIFAQPVLADPYAPEGSKVIEFRDADPFGGPIGNRQGELTIEDHNGNRQTYDVYRQDTYEGVERIELEVKD